MKIQVGQAVQVIPEEWRDKKPFVGKVREITQSGFYISHYLTKNRKNADASNIYYGNDEVSTELEGGDKMNFSQALEAVKNGKKISRSGWNGKGMFVYYIPANSYPAQTDIAKAAFGETVPYNAYLAIKTVQNTVNPWVASISDLLAEDWIAE